MTHSPIFFLGTTFSEVYTAMHARVLFYHVIILHTYIINLVTIARSCLVVQITLRDSHEIRCKLGNRRWIILSTIL